MKSDLGNTNQGRFFLTCDSSTTDDFTQLWFQANRELLIMKLSN